MSTERETYTDEKALEFVNGDPRFYNCLCEVLGRLVMEESITEEQYDRLTEQSYVTIGA